LPQTNTSDVLIIGSGAAGLTAALNLADRFKVTVLAKGRLDEGSTAWAQGGIAAVLEEGDTFESHIEDTMIAAAPLSTSMTSTANAGHLPRVRSTFVAPVDFEPCSRMSMPPSSFPAR